MPEIRPPDARVDDPGLRHFTRDFAAMGTRFSVTCVGGDQSLLEAAEDFTHRLEAKWTRFDESSELMCINNHPNEPVLVSPDTICLVREMVRGWKLTGHLFNPNVLAEMLDLGFAASQVDADRVTHWSQRVRSSKSMHDVRIDEAAGTVSVPRGVGLDAGGIGKGLAADMLAQQVLAGGALGVSVFASGEVRVAGTPPIGDQWRIGVEHPEEDDALIDTLEIVDGGVATSGTAGWVSHGGHHLVDPRTGRSADTATIQATVVAGLCVDAEIIVKACMLLTPDGAVALAGRLGAEALVVDRDLVAHMTDGWEDLCS